MAARAGNSKQSKGKKQRKFGRKRESLTQQRYNAVRRWEVNKRRKAQKYANKFNHMVRIKIAGEWEFIHPNKINNNNAGAKAPAPTGSGLVGGHSAWDRDGAGSIPASPNRRIA